MRKKKKGQRKKQKKRTRLFSFPLWLRRGLWAPTCNRKKRKKDPEKAPHSPRWMWRGAVLHVCCPHVTRSVTYYYDRKEQGEEERIIFERAFETPNRASSCPAAGCLTPSLPLSLFLFLFLSRSPSIWPLRLFHPHPGRHPPRCRARMTSVALFSFTRRKAALS